MTRQNKMIFGLAALYLCALAFGIPAASAQQQTPTVQAPQPTVPEYFTIEGQYVRVANNNEGFASLGYRTAQGSVGGDWLLLDVGIGLLKGMKDYTLKRENLNLKTPDGSMIKLATRAEFNQAGGCRNLITRDNMINDSIDYYPNTVSKPCILNFFAGKTGGISYDQVELSWERVCMGRLFFNVPQKITPGQYWLYIDYAGSQLQVPFRILTEDEQKIFSKKWEDIKKAHEAAFKQE